MSNSVKKPTVRSKNINAPKSDKSKSGTRALSTDDPATNGNVTDTANDAVSDNVGGSRDQVSDQVTGQVSNNTDIDDSKLTTAEKIDRYLQTLSNSDLSNLDQEKVLEMRKKLNPYGRTIAGSNKFLNFSITQITHEYWKKFLTTALVGFLNRMCDEWKVPNGVPVVSVYEYLDNPKLLDTPELAIEKKNQAVINDYEFNRKQMEKRIIVKEFLEELAQFNPDEHVRSAYRPNYKDKDRPILDTMAARIAINHACKKDADLNVDRLQHDAARGIKTKRVKKILKGKDGKTREVIREVPVDLPPTTPVAATPRDPLDPAHPKDPSVYSTVTNMIPPHDFFGRFKMYYTENYEELREAVKALYCENPEFELAINPYAVHDTKEQAEAFKKQHADEVIAEVFTVETGKWNFFDSFKKQRESVNFYNKNTIILEEMVKQIERDERLGQDLMAKRVEKEKKKNIIEAGPDAENFKKWVEENSELTKMGAKHIGDMADEETPENAIEVPVWRIAKGGLELTKDKFYSQAEAPSFVKEAHDAARAGVAPPALDARVDNL